nr:hypothetical protein [Enterococcus faecium]
MLFRSVFHPLVQPVPVQADETPVQFGARINTAAFITEIRSEERRVGKECRSRWSPYH